MVFDPTNKRLLFNLTEQETQAIDLLGFDALQKLESYANAYLTNNILEYRNRQRIEIMDAIKQADETKLASVIELLKNRRP